MNFTDAIKTCFKNYAKCSGDAARAGRSEYWYWVLFTVLASAAFRILDTIIFNVPFGDDRAVHPLYLIGTLVFLLPGINVAIRRLHDTNRSGWWLLIAFIPLIGIIVLLVWFCTKGTDGVNDYGNDPLQLTHS
jgi:uncharacterized membrane protein YhaH (DUF805 family)